MSERIDIKLFKAQSKFKVRMGQLLKLDNVLEDKEIEFYNISSEKMVKLNNYKDLSDFYISLIPITTNVDITISKEEFTEMLENQTLIFEEFLNNFTENIKNIMVNKQKSIVINQDINKFLKENGLDDESLKKLEEINEVNIEEEVKRNKEDIEKEIKELYELMKTDKQHRSEILEKINVLEKELSEINE